jgi:hypothetical protein
MAKQRYEIRRPDGSVESGLRATEVRLLAASGELDDSFFIREKGSGDWVPIAKVRGLFPRDVPPRRQAPAVDGPAASAPRPPAAPTLPSKAPDAGPASAAPLPPPAPPEASTRSHPSTHRESTEVPATAIEPPERSDSPPSRRPSPPVDRPPKQDGHEIVHPPSATDEAPATLEVVPLRNDEHGSPKGDAQSGFKESLVEDDFDEIQRPIAPTMPPRLDASAAPPPPPRPPAPPTPAPRPAAPAVPPPPPAPPSRVPPPPPPSTRLTSPTVPPSPRVPPPPSISPPALPIADIPPPPSLTPPSRVPPPPMPPRPPA